MHGIDGHVKQNAPLAVIAAAGPATVLRHPLAPLLTLQALPAGHWRNCSGSCGLGFCRCLDCSRRDVQRRCPAGTGTGTGSSLMWLDLQADLRHVLRVCT
jgi:hypothetical protein